MIKDCGYYGFFVINPKSGAKICSGGAIRNINKETDIGYFQKLFPDMITGFVVAMAPYRKVQEQISAEVKSMGLDGTIHGCIVDLDFFHHIMIDPFSGKMTFYYSEFMGGMRKFKTFESLIAHVSEELEITGSSTVDDSDIKHRQKLLSNQYRQLGKTDALVMREDKVVKQKRGKMIKVDFDSCYSVSRYINQLQRLFSENILRVWDDSLIEKLQNKKRKKVNCREGEALLLTAKPNSQK